MNLMTIFVAKDQSTKGGLKLIAVCTRKLFSSSQTLIPSWETPFKWMTGATGWGLVHGAAIGKRTAGGKSPLILLIQKGPFFGQISWV